MGSPISSANGHGPPTRDGRRKTRLSSGSGWEVAPHTSKRLIPRWKPQAEFRSCVGSVKSNVPGIELGGLLPKIAERADQMAFLRSFAHGNSGHGGERISS